MPGPEAPPLLFSLANLFVSFGFAFAGVFLALRAPPSPLVRWVSRGLVLWAITGCCFFYGGVALTYASLATIAVSWSLAYPLCLRALLVFLRGERPLSTWDRLGPWVFSLVGVVQVSQMIGFPLRHRIAIPLSHFLTIAYSATILTLIVRAYRRADAVLRRQMRWIVLGFYGGVGPQALVFSLTLLDGLLGGNHGFGALMLPSFCFGILIPLSILFAIVRYNLFDVDRLLSATASYNVVLVVLRRLRARGRAALRRGLIGAARRRSAHGPGRALAGARGGRRPGAPAAPPPHRSRLLQGAPRARPRHRGSAALARGLRGRARADADASGEELAAPAPARGLRGLRRRRREPSRRSSSRAAACRPSSRRGARWSRRCASAASRWRSAPRVARPTPRSSVPSTAQRSQRWRSR